MKPAAIRKFDWLYLGSIAVGVLGFALTYGTLADSVSAELTAPMIRNFIPASLEFLVNKKAVKAAMGRVVNSNDT
jgi:uncharacterized membrane protein